MPLPAVHRMHAMFQRAESLPKILDLLGTQSFGATGQDPTAARNERLDDARLAAR